jgi:hypothetical protein
MKNLAEHWDLPNTGIFYSKDVASEQEAGPRCNFDYFVMCSSLTVVMLEHIVQAVRWLCSNILLKLYVGYARTYCSSCTLVMLDHIAQAVLWLCSITLLKLYIGYDRTYCSS